MTGEILKTSELDEAGQNFGVKFDGGLVHLYVEDGDVGNWILKASFEPMFLNDLKHVATYAQKIYDGRVALT